MSYPVFNANVPKVMTACGSFYVIIDRSESGTPISVTIPSVKSGGCLAASMAAIAAVIKLALSSGATLDSIAKKLHGISCHKHNGDIQCCYEAIAQAIEMEIEHDHYPT